jgi:hypothetical protein
MIPIHDLFEAHLTVKDLDRSMSFFGGTLALELAQVFRGRRVAFYWIGRRGNSMLGLWEVGTGPQRLSLHLAFRVDLDNLLQAPERLRAANKLRSTFGKDPPTRHSSLLGCLLLLCFFTTRMETCWNSFQCCIMLRNPTSGSSGGVDGSWLK